jgi:hypothetical protein
MWTRTNPTYNRLSLFSEHFINFLDCLFRNLIQSHFDATEAAASGAEVRLVAVVVDVLLLLPSLLTRVFVGCECAMELLCEMDDFWWKKEVKKKRRIARGAPQHLSNLFSNFCLPILLYVGSVACVYLG